MKSHKFPLAICLSFLLSSQSFSANERQLVFLEEFDSEKGLNTDNWRIIEGDGCPQICGFGNHELQTYGAAHENLRLKDGRLIIEAHQGTEITSAKITTQARPGWRYGRFEIRAKLPAGVGTWPAIWMMPDKNTYGAWPKSGEIDIMEHVGYDKGMIHGTVHTEAYNHAIGTQKGGKHALGSATDAIHTYAIEWQADHIEWFIDGKSFFRFEKETGATSAQWPYDQPFHLIINLAIGGDWGGAKGVDPNALPARFEIDWVKVWQ